MHKEPDTVLFHEHPEDLFCHCLLLVEVLGMKGNTLREDIFSADSRHVKL